MIGFERSVLYFAKYISLPFLFCQLYKVYLVCFVPVCKGNDYNLDSFPLLRGFHKFVICNDVTKLIESGSSPHARGRRNDKKRNRHDARFIPACAGKTLAKTLKFHGFEIYNV